MLVLGIETTCDETSIALVENGFTILSHVISTQIDLHQEFGGVVPELACRRHIDIITPLIAETLKCASVTLEDVGLIAVAKGPGLIGALLIGINFAKGLAWALKKPLIGINHIEAHLYAAMMSESPEKLKFPALGVVLSGGHTSLVLIKKIGEYTRIGETIDDAIGEAFDKVAKMLDLPYPGGPQIERLAQGVDPHAISLKPGKVKGKPFDFSFSGMKTSVLYKLKGNNLKRETEVTHEEKRLIAASFQRAVFQDVIDKIILAIREYPVEAIYLGGGVTQNKELRTLLENAVSLPVYWPQANLSLDNAAMIAGLGYHKFMACPEDMLFTVEPETRIPF
ncbi:MAG: gcp [Chlamydiia bacterium]|nr:gcp [Chlamydiia bacterium]